MSDHVFLADQHVEWDERLSKTSSVHHFGTIVPRDHELLTEEQRAAADNGEALPVQYIGGRIVMVDRELLSPLGYKEAQVRQRGLDDALAALVTAQRAVEVARDRVVFVVGFESPEDGTDADCSLDNAEANLRDVSRILRLNGAR